MNNMNGYIMKEQVRNVVPSIMSSQLSRRDTDWDQSLPFYAVAAVSLVYFCAMVFSG